MTSSSSAPSAPSMWSSAERPGVRAGGGIGANRRLERWGAVERDRGPDRPRRGGGGARPARRPGLDSLPDRARARRARPSASSPAARTSSSSPRSSSSSSCRRCFRRPATTPRRRTCAPSSAPLTWLVLGLTLVTMVSVAAVAQAVIPGIGWGEGLLLGAIVAPTDPVAAIATFDRVGVTDRVRLLVEGESMVNDASGAGRLPGGADGGRRRHLQRRRGRGRPGARGRRRDRDRARGRLGAHCRRSGASTTTPLVDPALGADGLRRPSRWPRRSRPRACSRW